MTPRQLATHICPACRSDRLQLRQAPAAGSDASIVCDACGAAYPIVGGIARFVAASNYADSFGLQWNIHAKTQLDSHSGLPISRERVFEVTRWPRDLSGQRVLEAGSGAGRFTEVLLQAGADVVSFDYSSAVDANASNNRGKGSLHLFQGDIFQIPLQPSSFDKVLCLGVLQHTPDPARAFSGLARYVKPGGQLAIDVYRRDAAAMLQWKYLLRPITKRVDKRALYRWLSRATPPLVPLAARLHRAAGRFGARLMPIVQYAHLGLPAELNTQWAVLDTFDMYSPAHDHPQSLTTVRSWFRSAGFVDIDVRNGPNGVAGVGTRAPAQP